MVKGGAHAVCALDSLVGHNVEPQTVLLCSYNEYTCAGYGSYIVEAFRALCIF
jgi:hypothetical protein